MGVSLVLTYTEKGKALFESLNCSMINATYDDALDCNINIEQDEPKPLVRDKFFETYSRKGVKAIEVICRKLEPNPYLVFIKRVINKAKSVILK